MYTDDNKKKTRAQINVRFIHTYTCRHIPSFRFRNTIVIIIHDIHFAKIYENQEVNTFYCFNNNLKRH